MLLLLIMALFSHIVNFNPGVTTDAFYAFITVFLLFFIMVNIAEDFEKVRKVCWTLVFCTILLSINGLIMHFRDYDLVGNTPINGRIAWLSHFGDPNDFALAVISFFPFILINLFEKDIVRYRKLILLIIAAILLSAIYFTNSRGGFLALLVIFGFFAYKRWGLLRGLIAGAIFIGAAILYSPSRMGDVSPYEESASGRVNAWIAGLVMLKTHPIFGVGIGNYKIFHHRAAHSAFIQCLAELGPVGYFVWLTLIYSSFKGLSIVQKHSLAIYAKYARIIQLSLVGFLASAVFLSQAYTPILYMIFALSALVINIAEPPVALRRSLSPKDILIIIGLHLGRACLLTRYWLLYTSECSPKVGTMLSFNGQGYILHKKDSRDWRITSSMLRFPPRDIYCTDLLQPPLSSPWEKAVS